MKGRLSLVVSVLGLNDEKRFGWVKKNVYICTHKTTLKTPYEIIKIMTLLELVKKLDASVVLGEERLDMEVEHCFASDLMSDVLTLKDTPVLITGLCNVQTIRTCDMANLEVVIFVRNKRPTEDMIELAEDNDMVLICSTYSMFKTCGLLWDLGMKPLY